MNKKKSVLGRGLASILRNPDTDITTNSEKNNSVVGNICTIKIAEISVNPFQPRKEFNQEELEELAHSIENLGIIQPITVRKLGRDKYQLISGERRLKASKMAEKTEIPAFIRIANDQQMQNVYPCVTRRLQGIISDFVLLCIIKCQNFRCFQASLVTYINLSRF